ncbi:MAG: hypothetical protein JST35_11785 [Armatimonadetes bacterium]|jgi:hypothetical protein|nr:hypothetical protein [Armatimonadota bacterium]
MWTSLLAQVGEKDPSFDTPLKQKLWTIGVPILLLVIIFGGGYLFMLAERNAKKKK